MRFILSLVAAFAVLGCSGGHSSQGGGPAPGAPTLTSLTPSSGALGTSVTIAGTNLGDATAVTFNGVSAPIASKSGTSLTVTVPDGATSGPVSVTTPAGTATTAAGAGFTVTPPGQPDDPTSGSASSTAMWLEFTGEANYRQPSIAVDARGGIHAAYANRDQGPVRYAYCPSSCENEASWTRIDVSSAGEHLGGSYPFPTLALDPQGRPRVMFVHGYAGVGAFTYEYAACDADCTNTASWRVTPLLDVGDLHWPQQSGYFAIDSQGSAAFALHSYSTSYSAPTMLRYARCDASCTEAASWGTVDLVEAYPIAISLSFAGPGQPRIAFSRQAGYGDDGTIEAMDYAECDGDCLTASSWRLLDLAQVGDGARLSLRVEAGGKARLAAAMGQEGPYKDKLAILACDTGCGSDSANWKISTPFPFVPSSVALVLDGRGGMGLGIGTDDDLRVYACASDCVGPSGTWQGGVVETTLQLNEKEPVPLKPNCTTQGWRHFTDVGMAVDPDGKVRLVAGVLHLQGGFPGYCNANSDCPGGDVCVSGMCSRTDCNVYPDVALDRVYLLPN